MFHTIFSICKIGAVVFFFFFLSKKMYTIIFYLWIWSSSDFELNVRQSFPSVNNETLTCFHCFLPNTICKQTSHYQGFKMIKILFLFWGKCMRNNWHMNFVYHLFHVQKLSKSHLIKYKKPLWMPVRVLMNIQFFVICVCFLIHY